MAKWVPGRARSHLDRARQRRDVSGSDDMLVCDVSKRRVELREYPHIQIYDGIVRVRLTSTKW